MARTKTKPGPKPKYGEREEIHVLIPIDDLNYIRSVTDNVTEWVIQAIKEKRQYEHPEQHEHLEQAESIEELFIRAIKKDKTAWNKLFNHYYDRMTKRMMKLFVNKSLHQPTALFIFDGALGEFDEESAAKTDAIKKFEAFIDKSLDGLFDKKNNLSEMRKAKQLQQENLTDLHVNS